MKKLLSIGAAVGLAQFVVVLGLHAENKVDQAWVTQSLTSMPLAFTQNNGQWDARALFRAHAGGATMWLTADGTHYQFTRRIPSSAVGQVDSRPDMVSVDRKPRGFDNATDSLETLVIKAAFVGASSNPEAVGLEELEYKCNYFLGSDPAEWRTDVPSFRAVIYKDIYPGIDLKYYGNGEQMEYDFVVSPGADPSQIQVRYDGAQSVEVDAVGCLVVRTDWGEVTEQRPVMYQLAGGRRSLISGKYVLRGDNTFAFDLTEDYDRSLAVVIDPILSYSSYLGGGGDDYGDRIAVDKSGNAYITGATTSTNFPTYNAYQNSYGGGYFDIFVTKLNSSGSALLYSTYLGGTSEDFGWGIAVDTFGNAFITGETFSDDFPTENGYQITFGGGICDAYVAKLNSSGNAILYSTYLGGSVEDYSSDIAIDGGGNAYITGSTSSPNFPVANAYQPAYGGGSFDAFVAKFNSLGNAILFSTYLGGSGLEWGRGIAVDPDHNSYIGGYTSSANFPTQNAYQAAYGGGANDVFVTKLNSSGDALLYSTYLGGSLGESGWGITVDTGGKAYICGKTSSTNFPTQNAYQTTYGGGTNDAFVAKLGSSGNALLYSTYLGGAGDEQACDILVDVSGSAYLTGFTGSADFPMQSAYQATYGGGAKDVFVAKLGSSGNTLPFSTYLGGSLDDAGSGIAAAYSGSVYITGNTNSTNFPIQNAYQVTGRGSNDAFVTKLTFTCCVGTRGNANGDVLDKVTVSDVTFLLAWMFGIPSGPPPGCMEEANVNGDLTPQGGEKVSVSDVTYLLNYLFGIPSGPAPKPCP